MPISAAVRRLVRERAGNRCEYCRLSQDDLPLITLHVGRTSIGRLTVRVLNMNDEDRLELRRTI